MKQLDHFTSQTVNQMLSYQSDDAIHRHTGAPLANIKRLRVGACKDGAENRRFLTFRDKEPIAADSTAVRLTDAARLGSEKLLRRQLVTGQHFLSAERFHSTVEALAA